MESASSPRLKRWLIVCVIWLCHHCTDHGLFIEWSRKPNQKQQITRESNVKRLQSVFMCTKWKICPHLHFIPFSMTSNSIQQTHCEPFIASETELWFNERSHWKGEYLLPVRNKWKINVHKWNTINFDCDWLTIAKMSKPNNEENKRQSQWIGYVELCAARTPSNKFLCIYSLRFISILSAHLIKRMGGKIMLLC